MQKSGHYKR